MSCTLQATWEGDRTTPMIDMMAYRFYSPSNSYITLSTSTKNPKVNTYMLFHVKTSMYVPRIYYQVSHNLFVLLCLTLKSFLFQILCNSGTLSTHNRKLSINVKSRSNISASEGCKCSTFSKL